MRVVDFGFSDDQLMLQDIARRIAQEKIAPVAAQFDAKFPSSTAVRGWIRWPMCWQ